MVTRLTCVSRIDQFHSNASRGGLLGHKLLQLVEAPACHHAIKMLVPRLRPAANILKLFHANHSAVVPFSFINKLFRKNMVFVFYSAPFVARYFLQNFLRTSSSLRLKASSDIGALGLKLLSRSSVDLRTRRCRSNVGDATVDTHHPIAFTYSCLVFHNDVDVPYTNLLDYSRGGGVLSCKGFMLMFSKKHGDSYSSLDSRHGNSLGSLLVRKNASIIVDTARTELLGGFSLSFKLDQSRDYTTNRSYRQVSRQPKQFSHIRIAKLVQCNSVVSFLLNSHYKDMVASIRKRATCFFKCLVSWGCGQKFAAYCRYLHVEEYLLCRI